ncbi:MFS transporter [Rugosimonospora acidiphila]|uniref:MFS transporter n=1 Tax=Rugosimonospora acidiphila TaxID=556531 RepID=A0ABP9RI82_9ACTN
MRAWLRSTAGGLSRTYWVIWSGILVNRAGGFAVLFLTLYLTGPRHLTPSLAGTIVGGYGVGAAGGTMLGGVLADRWGRRRTLLLAYFTGSAVLLALALAKNLGAIAACVVLMGAAQGMPQPAFVAAIVDITPEADRPRAFNLQFWAFNLGQAAAGLIAGAVARLSFVLLFAADATSTLITAILILLWVPESVPHRSGPEDRVAAGGGPGPGPGPGPARAGVRLALTDRIFMVFVGLTLLQAVLSAQNTSILPLSMTADHIPPAGYGLLMSLAGLLIVAGQLFVPGLIRGLLHGRVLALSLGLLALGYGALTFAGSLAFYLACAAVWTVGAMLGAPANATIISDLAPPAVRARYQAVFYLTFSLASFIAPALGGISWQYLGSWHWLLCAGVGLVACVGHLVASPARERQVARRAAERAAATPKRRALVDGRS